MLDRSLLGVMVGSPHYANEDGDDALLMQKIAGSSED
jgi:hypothetical protein